MRLPCFGTHRPAARLIYDCGYVVVRIDCANRPDLWCEVDITPDACVGTLASEPAYHSLPIRGRGRLSASLIVVDGVGTVQVANLDRSVWLTIDVPPSALAYAGDVPDGADVNPNAR